MNQLFRKPLRPGALSSLRETKNSDIIPPALIFGIFRSGLECLNLLLQSMDHILSHMRSIFYRSHPPLHFLSFMFHLIYIITEVVNVSLQIVNFAYFVWQDAIAAIIFSVSAIPSPGGSVEFGGSVWLITSTEFLVLVGYGIVEVLRPMEEL